MKKSTMLKMAAVLVQDQKLKMQKGSELPICLLESYSYNSSYELEDFLKFYKDEKELPKKFKKRISLCIVRFQVGRRGIISNDEKWWNYFLTSFCDFSSSDVFLGYKKEVWVKFFISVSKLISVSAV